MAKYLITHSCGHEATIQLFGKSSGRDWAIQKEEGKLCLECFQAAQQKERMEAGEQAAQLNFQMGCKPLEGSEKQIAWAETIRFTRLDALQQLITETAVRIEQQSINPVMVAVLASMRETFVWAAGLTDGKWWIDHRDPYVKQTQQETISGFIAMVTGRRAPESPRSKIDLVKGMMLVSPHLTLTAAETMGLADEWKKRQEDEAKKLHDEPLLRTRESARDAARLLGLKGKINVWSSKCGDHRRIYADEFTYYHLGKQAGTLENKSNVSEEDLKSYCVTLCRAWKGVEFYA